MPRFVSAWDAPDAHGWSSTSDGSGTRSSWRPCTRVARSPPKVRRGKETAMWLVQGAVWWVMGMVLGALTVYPRKARLRELALNEAAGGAGAVLTGMALHLFVLGSRWTGRLSFGLGALAAFLGARMALGITGI